MNFLTSQTEAVMKQWAQNLTLEQIEEYERQGMDMSEYRIIYEERQAAEQRVINAIALEKLDAYKNIRSAEDDFVNDVAKFNKLSDKKKQSLEQVSLVYGKVVQANSALFKPCEDEDNDGGGIVFLFALDAAHRYNEEWLTKTAERISEVKESVPELPETTTEKIFRLLGLKNSFLYDITIGSKQEAKKFEFLPEDCREFIGILSNDSSSFCLPVGKTLNEEGADAWCATLSLDDQRQLPFSQIPHNQIVPLLLTEPPKKKDFGGMDDYALLIPPTYYTKDM